MPSRRVHEKHRHGCQQCKARRVKCDLRLPVCGNCERRLEQCQRNLIITTHPPNWTTISPPAISPAPTPALTQPTGLPLVELELMHHFSTVVYRTLSEETIVQNLWQHDVPKEALHHTHLMHAILALSALHQQFDSKDTSKSDEYQRLAIHHYGSALAQLKLLVVNVEKTNCGSLLAAATLLGFFSSVHALLDVDKTMILDSIWHNHQLLRGIPRIMEHVGGDFGELKLSAIFKVKPWDDEAIPAGFQRGMNLLRENIREFGHESKHEIYMTAVKHLEENVKAEIANPEHITISYMFLPAADRKYMELVVYRDQMAMVILAHYGLILHRQRHRWWMGDNGFRLFNATKEFLKEEFHKLVEWPQRFLMEHADTQQLEAPLYYS